MVLGRFVGGFGWFQVVSGRFRWFLVLVTTLVITISSVNSVEVIQPKKLSHSSFEFCVCENVAILIFSLGNLE